MSLAISTITANIAALSVTGVMIKDTSGIPDEWDGRVPILFPEPIGFVSNFRVVRETYGIAGQAKLTVTYDLTYTLAHSKVGKDRGVGSLYPDMVAKAFAVIDAILGIDTVQGAVEVAFKELRDFGVILDPSGKASHGCKTVFAITEYVN